MVVLVFNFTGMVMLAACFGAAFLVGYLLGVTGEGPLMIIAGPLCTIVDGAYRAIWSSKQWFNGGAGGTLFFLPVWALGLVWLVLGIVYTIRA